MQSPQPKTPDLVAAFVDRLQQGRVVGWEQPPDSSMLRYLMSTLGKDEDFGEEVTLHHTADEGIDISRWIDKEIEEKQRFRQAK